MKWTIRRARLAPLCASLLLLLPCSQGAAKGMEQGELKQRKEWLEAAVKQAHEEEVAQIREDEKRGIFATLGPPPTLVPFLDWDFYYLTQRPASWKPNAGQNLESVMVPIGFVTDLASIPRVFWTALPPQGRYAYAAIIHDYLYWTQDRTRDEADEILKIAMQDAKVNSATVDIIYTAVRGAGQAAWNANKRLKAGGERRVLIKFPDNATVSWVDWKNQPDVFAPFVPTSRSAPPSTSVAPVP